MYIIRGIDFENASLEELVEERKKILRDIRRFERDYLNPKPKDELHLIDIKPSPEVIYQMNNRYLVELTNVINEKFNSIVWDR